MADIFVTCAKKGVEGAKVYTIGGDTVDVAGFVAALDKVRLRRRNRKVAVLLQALKMMAVLLAGMVLILTNQKIIQGSEGIADRR